MMSFDNTEVAFRRMSNTDLNRAYLLFKTISSNAVVALGNYGISTALALHLPINWIIKPTVYAHFVGGETIDECKPVVQSIAQHTVIGILDYSVEGSDSTQGIQAALAETLRTIENAATDPNIPFAVFKPTAFAPSYILEQVSPQATLSPQQEIEWKLFQQRVETLCAKAHSLGVRIMIDAEDVKYQYAIDTVTDQMMARYNTQQPIVFNTFQMYRTDRLAYLKASHAKAQAQGYWLGAKFVRGAYMERERKRAQEHGYPSPIHHTKAETDTAYNEAIRYSIEHIEQIAIFNGTHNEHSSLYMTQLMATHQIAPNDPRCWFAQLYGMSDHISFNLAHAGYNVAKYIPYGPVKHVLPYLFRRVEENTSVAGQTGRELSLITKEKRRRKAQASI
jgi:proline dehydrogenase